MNTAKPIVVWMTGLSGAGKSTLADLAAQSLRAHRSVRVAWLDGDTLRAGLNADLGFDGRSRAESVRRAAHVAALLAAQVPIVIVSLISPTRPGREAARRIVEASGARFLETFISCPLAECEARDPKGHYQRARRGELQQFTGISAPYACPDTPEIRVRTDGSPLGAALHSFLTQLDPYL